MDLLRLEQQRQALEQSLQQLRANLRHWQTYSAELEGLTEEIQSAGASADLESISKTYAGVDLVNEKEIRELAGIPGDAPRSAAQVLGMVSRRQEYVQKNIDALQKQYFESEGKLEELDFAAVSANRHHGPGCLPLTEIREELDEAGNVISSRISQPEAQTTELVDALRKAGLSDHDLESVKEEEADDDDDDDGSTAKAAVKPALVDGRAKSTTNLPSAASTEPIPNEPDISSRPPIRKKSVSFTADTKLAPEPVRQDSDDGRKSVSFNDKVAVMPAAPPPDSRSVSFSPKVEEIPAGTPEKVKDKTDSDFRNDMKGYTFKPGDRVAELDDETSEVSKFHIVMPEDESEEDAATRREMLEYYLNDVGHVVAQMDLDPEDYELGEDENSDFTSSEYLEEDTPYTSGLSDSDAESEDEHGRSTRRVISDDYHKEIQELQRRLIGSLGPAAHAKDAAEVDAELDPHDVHRLLIRDPPAGERSGGEKKASCKKRVSFAEAVADPPGATPTSTTLPSPAPAAPPTPAFPASRSARPAPASGRIIADQLVERAPIPRPSAPAPSPHHSDPALHRRQLAAEYYRKRNDFIRQQPGGFHAAGLDAADQPLMEERDGQMKKVSKFKAARIRG